MTIWCKHVHRIEPQKFLKKICADYFPVKRDIPVFLILDMHVQNKQEAWSPISSPAINNELG